MSRSAPSPSFAAALASQEPFLRRLARALISDEHAAEDAVQETLLAAWKTGQTSDPVTEGSPTELPTPRLRAWLATVLKRKSFSRLRSAATQRERTSPESESLETVEHTTDGTSDNSASDAPDEIAVRLERQMLLQDATLTLPAIYRSVVVLRYQDALSATEIAERLDTPVATVRSRLHRGIELLRHDLTSRFRASGHKDPRTAWLSAIAPLAFPEVAVLPFAAEVTTAASSTALGSLTTSSSLSLFPILAVKKTILAAVSLIAFGAIYFNPSDAQPAASPSSLVPASPAIPLDALASPILDETRSIEVVHPKAAKPRSTAPVITKRVAQTITGRVLLMDGTPLGNLSVAARHNADRQARSIASTRTDADGRYALNFRARDADAAVVLFASDTRYPLEGAILSDVTVGSTGVEMRIDAIDIRLLLPPGFQLASDTDKYYLTTSINDASPIEKPFLPGSYQQSEEGKAPRLYRAGPGYTLTVNLGELGDGELTAIVPAGLASGRYEFELSQLHPGTPSYRVSLVGEEMEANSSQDLSVFLSRNQDEDGVKRKGEIHGSITIKGGQERTRTKDACLPGISKVFANFRDRGDLGWYLASCKDKTITLKAGTVPSIEVEIAKGGRLAITVASLPATDGAGPHRGLLRYRYLDGSTDGLPKHWKHISPMAQNKQGQWDITGFVTPGGRFVSNKALSPGQVEVNLTCDGFQEVYATLQIVPGEFTEWDVALEPQ